MFLPIGDTPNPNNFRPWITYALIAANVVIYVLISLPLSGAAVDPNDPAVSEYLRNLRGHIPPNISLHDIVQQLSMYELFTVEHGFKPGAPAIDDLFFSLFLHGGLLHLAGNMLFLWIYGDNVEHRLGRVPYLIIYLASGVAATLAFTLFAQGSMVPLVGASGAISGVLGLYFLMFPRNRVKVFVALFPFFFQTVLVPSRLVLGFFLIVDNLFPALLSAKSNVAYGAHIGGFVFGAIVAFVWERVSTGLPVRASLPRAQTRGATHAAQTPMSRTGDEQLAEAIRLADRGQPDDALKILRSVMAAGRGAGVDQAKLYLTLGLIRLQQSQEASAYQHLLTALDFDPDSETEERIRRALDRVRVYRRPN